MGDLSITEGDTGAAGSGPRGAIDAARGPDRLARRRNIRRRFLDALDRDALTSAATRPVDVEVIDRMNVPRREHDGRQEDQEDSEEDQAEGREEEEVGLLRSPA